ncbi:leukocyte tyrosine kinase receptor [Patella vulgata]|uniref:leukocyte tyrosine kinase receptor n=1 Tax=Patella vulgata TaxID=6465 RepID=UPI0024A81600|nr:leukocyte tyrosine kinase receptor [Patella vulgata]
MCIWSDFTTKKFSCLCPGNKTLSSDGMSCIEPKASILQTLAVEKMPIGYIVVICVSCAVILFVILAVFVVINYHRRKNDKTKLSKLQRAMSPSNVIGGRGFQQAMLPSILMLNNPNYNMVQPTTTPDPVLTEISRKHLTLISLIGQGAFGEVYEGVLSGPPYDTDVSIAVKTLPAMCTEQTELDFLMEAVIISKFSHPNIVSFIGVCFDKEPRFIILELLEGGDVRSFLRESRPKPSRPSELTVLDLLKLALDIAKGCQHLEEKHFIHRDIAARNCLLSKKGPSRVAKIADFGLARDIYRSDYYKKAGKAMLPVKWMPPEAFLDGMFTSKTDVW